jgi:hypothetical protein
MEFGNSIVGASDELVRDGIQSRGFQSGVQGWRISRNGDVEINNLVARGSLSTGIAPDPRITIDDDATLSSPAIAFYDGTNADPAFIFGYDDGTQTGLRGMTGHLAGAGTDGVSWDLSTAGFYIADEGGNISFGIDTELDVDINAAYAMHPGGVAALRSDNASTFLMMPVDGKVGTGTTTTAIGTTDTNISGANGVNVPVIADRAYLAIVQLDYFRSTTGALARMDMKLWNGAVGGTQLGGTARIPMAGPLSTARRTLVGVFMWRAASTQTMANLNVSLATTDGTVGQNWTAEVNQGYSISVMEFGTADNVSNL